jgi:hypothetical protein
MKLNLFYGLCLMLLASPSDARPATIRAATARSDARLKQMVRDFGTGERDAAIFRKLKRSVLLPQLERLQSQASGTSAMYRYLTFTLAYFAQDYAANVQRLMIPVRLWQKQDRRWYAYDGGGHEPLEDVPFLLERLYEHHRDPALLRILFEMGLDGGPAGILAIRRVQLLTAHALEVMKVLQRSPGGTEEALCDLCNDVGADDEEYRRAVTSIRRASRQADPPLRRSIHRFLQRATAQYRASRDNRNRSFRGTNLERARLSKMDLTGADLRGTILRDADLRHTDLRGANLKGADLRGAQYNSKTRWPAGFNPRRRGARLVQPARGP